MFRFRPAIIVSSHTWLAFIQVKTVIRPVPVVFKGRRNRDNCFACFLTRLAYAASISTNVTCVCKNALSVNHVLLECPITK